MTIVLEVAGGIVLAVILLLLLVVIGVLLSRWAIWATGWPDGIPVWSRDRWIDDVTNKLTWRSWREGMWRS